MGTDFAVAGSRIGNAVGGLDWVGSVVSSSVIAAAPPRKLFGRVAKNSIKASWATQKRASIAVDVPSSGGGASRSYGRGIVVSYVGRLGGLAVSSLSKSISSSWYGIVFIRFSSSCSVSSSSSLIGGKSSGIEVVGCWTR